jgi:hypothetical protein
MSGCSDWIRGVGYFHLIAKSRTLAATIERRRALLLAGAMNKSKSDENVVVPA